MYSINQTAFVHMYLILRYPYAGIYHSHSTDKLFFQIHYSHLPIYSYYNNPIFRKYFKK